MIAKVVKSVFAALLLSLAIGPPAAAGDTEKLTVVELFTSQGCSSCPPADRFLEELAQRDDILALSWNIDYWDYLGWRDTLARPANTARQKAYNHTMGKSGVYTPQMIIDGRYEIVGSRREEALALIAKRAKAEPDAKFTLTGDGAKRRLEIGAGKPKKPATVWLIAYDRMQSVAIRRGELQGKTMTYHNVVRDDEKLGQWTGAPAAFDLDLDALRARGWNNCAILLQEGGTGPILGAIRLRLNP